MKKILIFAGLSLALTGLAFAEEHEYENEHEHSRSERHERGRGGGIPVNAPPAFVQECGSCHIAYPPGLLPAQSWKRLMSGLNQHFGSDASLDAATTKVLTDWLVANSGTYKRVRNQDAPPNDRITKSAWFERKHDEISPSVYKRASIKSAANCGACHGGAQQGNFNEHDVNIPR